MPKIEIIKGPREGDTIELSRQVTLIGRTKECEVFLDDSQASRKHAKIFEKEGRMFILDLGSRNGTFVNGKRINELELTPYCEIQIGSSVLRFEIVAELDDQGNLMEPILAQRKAPSFDITRIDIKGYDIVEMIGKGGMGYVCKARQISMDRVVAIKILNEKFSNNPAFVSRFISEARAAGRLNHPNVIQVHDVGQYNNIYFFSMELLQGKTVLELLREKKTIGIADAIYYTIETAKALEYAHRLGIIHQDVKPDNIMVTTDNQVKLADLGISKVFDGNTDLVENEVMGSPHFMSPEQAMGKSVDGRSDIYSLGVALFQMLASDTPFSGVSIQEILKKHVSAAPPSVKDFNPKVPTKLANIVLKMMAKDPNDRYRSATELIEALQPLYDKLVPKKGGAKVKLEIRKLAKEQVSKTAKKKVIIIAAIAVAVIVIGVSLALAFSGNDDPENQPDISPVATISPTDDKVVNSPPAEMDILYQRFTKLKESDLQAAREVGTEILTKYQDMKDPGVQRKLQRVNDGLKEIDLKISRELIAGLSSGYNELVSGLAGATPESILDAVRKYIEGNAKTLDTYAEDTEVKRIRDDLKRREKEAREALAASLQREFNELKKSVLRHIESNQFTLADHKLEEYYRLHDDQFTEEIKELREKIQAAEKTYYEDTIEQAEDVAHRKELSLAISILKAFLKEQEGRKYTSSIRNKLEEYTKELEAITVDILQKGEEYEKDFDFESARKEYEKLATQVTYDDEKSKMVKELISTVHGEDALMTYMIKEISAKAPMQLTFDLTGKLGSKARNWSIKSLNAEKVTIANSQGIEQSVRWTMIPGVGFDKLVSSFGGDLKAEKLIRGYARILKLKGLDDRADEILEKLG